VTRVSIVTGDSIWLTTCLRVCRIQPNEETRQKQLMLWKKLVLQFCEATKVGLGGALLEVPCLSESGSARGWFATKWPASANTHNSVRMRVVLDPSIGSSFRLGFARDECLHLPLERPD
jgi:hypothetical protein